MTNATAAVRFDEIYDATRKEVLAFITARSHHTADINDIFQETYLELYNILTNRGAGYVTHEKGLVMRIAKRKLAKHYSLLARLKIFVSLYTAKNEEESDLIAYEVDDFSTEDFAVNQLLLEEARRFIREKPETVRKVFYLMYDVGLTIPEIARALSISESNVKNKLYRTLKDLKKLLS